MYTCVTQKSSNSDWQMYSSQPFMYGMLSEVGGRELVGGKELEGGREVKWVLVGAPNLVRRKCINNIAKIIQTLVKLLRYLC